MSDAIKPFDKRKAFVKKMLADTLFCDVLANVPMRLRDKPGWALTWLKDRGRFSKEELEMLGTLTAEDFEDVSHDLQWTTEANEADRKTKWKRNL